MKRFFGLILILAVSVGVFSQHTLDFIIPPCPHVEVNENLTEELVFSAFPNPASEQLIVEINYPLQENIISFEIYNILGECILKKDLNRITDNNRIEINVSDFIPGTYILRLKNQNEVFHKKIIIK